MKRKHTIHKEGNRMKDKIYNAFVATVCFGGALGIGWGALVLLGKLVTAWGWW